jgi:lipopolysaccharide export system protein LptC
VTTEDNVNITRGNIDAKGVGALGKTDLKQFSLNKEVTVDINEESEGKIKKITITCDGPLNIDYIKQEAVFNDNVKAIDVDQELYADKMTGYFDSKTKKLNKIVCEGNVKIVKGQDISYSEKAIYDSQGQKVSLVGRPRLIIYSSKEDTLKEDTPKESGQGAK